MEWNLKAPCWDLGEVDKATITLPNIETMDDSSRFGVYRMKGEFCVDLKLGQVGNSGTESVVLAKSKDDAVAGASVGAAQGSKVVTSPSGSSKRARAINNATMTVSCLVDGCNSDLSNCRDYHRRHKVCELHSKTPEVTIGGLKQRFCQQCSRFHSLEQFDERKRSCRKRLDGHNRRRRKPQPEPPTRHGSFLSNYQGTQLLPFSSAHVYSSTAMVSPDWSVTSSADARLHHSHNQHHQQQDHLFIGSSPTSSYNNNSNNNNCNNKKEGKQLAFLQGENPSTAALNNQSTPPLFPPASSVCQSTLLPLSESCGVRSKIMFCDDNNNSSNNNRSSLITTNSVHDDSPCALSLLSSSQTQNTPCLNQMVHHPSSMSLMQQPLGLCLQDSNSLESVVPNNGSDHCSSMYNLGSDHDGSQCNEAPQLFPFQWE